MKTTIADKIDELIAGLETEMANAEQIALNTMLGAYSYRIFNLGNDSNGTQIGNYKAGPYKRKRARNGKEVSYVNLDYSSGLRFAIVVENVNGKWVLKFNNAEAAKIAGYQHERYKKAIFEPSKEEVAIAKEAFDDYLKEKIQEIFNSW